MANFSPRFHLPSQESITKIADAHFVLNLGEALDLKAAR